MVDDQMDLISFFLSLFSVLYIFLLLSANNNILFPSFISFFFLSLFPLFLSYFLSEERFLDTLFFLLLFIIFLPDRFIDFLSIIKANFASFFLTHFFIHFSFFNFFPSFILSFLFFYSLLFSFMLSFLPLFMLFPSSLDLPILYHQVFPPYRIRKGSDTFS